MSYIIKIQPAGVSYQSDTNLLDDALTQNVSLEHSCKTGECGVCGSEVLSGSVLNENGKVITHGQVLVCQSKALEDVSLRANYYPELAALKLQTLPCKVSSVEYVTEDILVIKFRFPPNAIFDYLPGQYVDLSFSGIKRSYSIANAISESKEVELHIRKVDNGKMSDALFNKVKQNQLMRMEGPKGTFFLRKTNKPIIMLATGTGIAPIKAMLEQLVNMSDSREVFVFWGMRYASELYYEQLDIFTKAPNHIHFVPVLSQESSWEGEQGYVQDVVCQYFPSLIGYEVYACGALAMIEDAKVKFFNQQLPKDAFHSDAFTPAK